MTTVTDSMVVEFQRRRVYHSDFERVDILFEKLLKKSANLKKFKRAHFTMIVAEPGMGKTTLIEDLKEEYPPTQSDTELGVQQTVPIVQIKIGLKFTARKIVDAICEEFSLPPTTSDKPTYLETRAAKILNDAGCKLLAIDESQEFLLHSTALQEKDARVFMRTLGDMISVPMVFLGTPGYENFVKTEGTMGSRVCHEEHILVMDAPIETNTRFHKVITGMLKNLAEEANRELGSSMTPLEFSQRMYLLSSGTVRGIANFLVEYLHEEQYINSTKRTIDIEDCQRVMSGYKSGSLIDKDIAPFDIPKKKLSGLMRKYHNPDCI